jgi:hypothetical protein
MVPITIYKCMNIFKLSQKLISKFNNLGQCPGNVLLAFTNHARKKSFSDQMVHKLLICSCWHAMYFNEGIKVLKK